MSEQRQAFVNALWRLYNRPNQPTPWAYGGNLPWDDPAFSERMLREHLDQTHGAASRVDISHLNHVGSFFHDLYAVLCISGRPEIG